MGSVGWCQAFPWKLRAWTAAQSTHSLQTGRALRKWREDSIGRPRSSSVESWPSRSLRFQWEGRRCLRTIFLHGTGGDRKACLSLIAQSESWTFCPWAGCLGLEGIHNHSLVLFTTTPLLKFYLSLLNSSQTVSWLLVFMMVQAQGQIAPWLGGSTGWSVILCTEMLGVRFPGRSHT